MPKREIVAGLNYAGMPHIKRGSPVISSGMKRVREEGRRIGCHAGVQIIAVIESLRKGVHATELQAARLVVSEVHCETVIRAYAFRKPVCGVPDSVIGESSARRKVKRSRRISCRAR